MTENCTEHCINIWGAIGLQQNLAEVLGRSKPTMVVHFLKRGALLSSNKSIHLNLLGHCWCLRSGVGASDTCTGILLWELVSLCLYVFSTVCSSSSSFTTHQLQLNWLFPFSYKCLFDYQPYKVVSLQLRRSYHSITNSTNRSIRNVEHKTFTMKHWTTNIFGDPVNLQHEQLTCVRKCVHMPTFWLFFLILFRMFPITSLFDVPVLYTIYLAWLGWWGAFVSFNK